MIDVDQEDQTIQTYNRYAESWASDHPQDDHGTILAQLKKLMPAFLRLAKEARAAGTKVVLGHARSNDGITEDEKETVQKLALAADIYLPSADEFMQLREVSSIEEGLTLLDTKAAGITIVKNSDKGALTMLDGKVVTILAFSVKPIHTIGAGDSFNAGLIAAQYRGEELLESIKFGCVPLLH